MRKLSLSAFNLRIIAIISMGLSHIVLVLWEVLPLGFVVPVYALRGITFPIMAFFITEGFKHTSNIKRYMLRLLIFATIAQIPYMLAFEFFILNIIFTMLLGLICLALFDKLYVKAKKHALFIVIFIVILLISSSLVEGSIFGPLLIFLFYVIKDEKKRRTYPLIFIGVLTILMNLLNMALISLTGIEAAPEIQAGAVQLEIMMTRYFIFPIGSFVIIPFLRAYNGERGRSAKYLFYAFYPLHLAILAVIAYALGLNDFSIIGF